MNDIQALEALLTSINHGQRPQTVASTPLGSSSQAAPQPVAAPLAVNQAQANPPNLQALLEAMNTPQGRTTLATMDVGTQALLLKTIQALGGAPAPAGTVASVPTVASATPPVVPVPKPESSPAPTVTATAVPALNAHQLLAQQLRMQANAATSNVASHQALLTAALAGTATGRPPMVLPHQPPPPAAARMPPPAQSSAVSYSSMTGLSRQSSAGTAPKSGSTTGLDRAESSSPVNKREQKRAANRISAQRSRKRKKQYIEELKEENDELRKLNQMLEVVPDLIISFDSSGILRFVSKSSQDFFGCPSEELVGTSFWHRLCSNSVKRLKAVFMDSLAKRQDDVPSVPLGHRVWEVRLKDQDPDSPSLALRGALHFAEGSPECVCTIRHWDEDDSTATAKKDGATAQGARRSSRPEIPTEVGNADMITSASSDDSRVISKKKSTSAIVSVSGSSKKKRAISAYSGSSEEENMQRVDGTSDVSSNSSRV